MKIPLLLVQYLYKNRKLALPGIGIFTLDKSIVLPEENDHAQLSLPNGVQFQDIHVTAADKDLISYICENTGKIKPLATADLESYLTLGMEMLNIGKPFYLEGIGTISKNNAGKLNFSPGTYAIIKDGSLSVESDHHKKRKPETEQSASISQSPQNRSLLKGIALIAGLVIIGWGGYLMYKKTKPDAEKISETAISLEPIAQTADTLALRQQKDSGKLSNADSIHPANFSKDSAVYKFVILSTYNKAHALRRYRQLLSFDLRAHLYEKDSSFFKVYFQFPARAKDTIRIKDSIRRQYAHEVLIEE